jgi:hypothetical protein
MQNLLNLILCKSFCFQKMPNSHDITALTRWVRDIFNKVCQWSIACEMSALRIENAYYLLLISIDYHTGWIMHVDIFEQEIVSKHFAQLRIRNKKVVLSHQINNKTMSNEVSFCFSKTFVIYRCLLSKSSLFD